MCKRWAETSLFALFIVGALNWSRVVRHDHELPKFQTESQHLLPRKHNPASICHTISKSLDALWVPGFENCGCSEGATIVTAYFDIGNKSKHSGQEYYTWTARFFSLPDNMVVFTDTNSSSSILTARSATPGCTLIVLQNLKETRLGREVDWTLQHEKDPEKDIHSPELYLIWIHKSVWLSEAASKNPFRSTHLFWADSGQFRDHLFIDLHVLPGEKWITSFNFIPTCKIIFLSVAKFEYSELRLSEDGRALPLDSRLDRLGAGNFGGDICALKRWESLFLRRVRWNIEHDVFTGKEQPIFWSVCVEHRDMCFIVDGHRVKESGDIWFAMQPVLHGVTVPVPQYHLQDGERMLTR